MNLWTTGSIVGSVILRIAALSFLRIIPSSYLFDGVIIGGIIYLVTLIPAWREAKSKRHLYLAVRVVEDEVDDDEGNKIAERISTTGSVIAGPPMSHTFRTLTLGGVSPVKLLTVVSLITNLLLVGFVLDFTYSAFHLSPQYGLGYTRVGYVSDTYATLSIRHPTNDTLQVFIRQAPSSENKRVDDWVFVNEITPQADNSTDYVTSLVIDNLWPNTKFDYLISLPSNNSSSSKKSIFAHGIFHTASELPSGNFTFLATSCLKPHFPYNPIDSHTKIIGLEMYSYLVPEVDFLLFLGDFIYADVPKFLGTTLESYNNLYRQVYKGITDSIWKYVPTIHVFDDHEIINDYDIGKKDNYYDTAITAWNSYQASGNPPQNYGKENLYYSFERQGIPFFFWDTRSYRSLETAKDDVNKTMLGQHQLSDFFNWLEYNRDAPFKFIISSVPLTKNWRIPTALGNILNVTDDTWGGYLNERQQILTKMWQVGGCIVISGDRHEAAAIKFPAPKIPDSLEFIDQPNSGAPALTRNLNEINNTHDVFEFSTSPLSQFYIPFSSSHAQLDDEDITLYYEPRGNFKLAKFDVIYGNFENVENSNGLKTKRPVIIKYSCFINGIESWSFNLTRYQTSEKALATRVSYVADSWLSSSKAWLTNVSRKVRSAIFYR